MGYDKHSLVINPGFDDYSNFVPKERLNYGKNLGEEFKVGLAVDAVWSNISPRTAFQDDVWQVGARIFEKSTVIDEPLDTTTLIYPNPAKGHFYVLNNTPGKIYQTIIVYNSRGDVILQQDLDGQFNTIHLNKSMSAGLYNIELAGADLTSYNTKLIVID